jgi:4-amino-4-deoxy-L-arabinose transferase-like glycosyltransferase
MWLVFFVTAASWTGFELLADSLGRASAARGRAGSMELETAGSAELETAGPRAVEGKDNPRLKYWRLAFYIALGFGFLAKGPLAWLPLLTVLSSKFYLRDISLTRRFWFFTGMLGAFAIVCTWGIPALIRTSGEFFRVGIGRHVVERSFNVMEGHGANSWNTYLATMPFYFLTVFVSFFPWSLKLPALTKHLWRKRDAIDNYLICGILIVFVVMSLVKTKLPHYTLPAFPLLALLLARHLFHLSLPQFAKRAAIGAVVTVLAVDFIAFPLLAPTFPSAQLYKMSRNDLLPEMDFANIDYAEPSVVWYFRGRAHGFFRGLNPDQLEQFMNFPGPRFAIVPTSVAQAFSAKIHPDWKTYRAHGFTIVKGRPTDLTLILKQSQ